MRQFSQNNSTKPRNSQDAHEWLHRVVAVVISFWKFCLFLCCFYFVSYFLSFFEYLWYSSFVLWLLLQVFIYYKLKMSISIKNVFLRHFTFTKLVEPLIWPNTSISWSAISYLSYAINYMLWQVWSEKSHIA
jgi:hypothetical protein